MDPYYLWPPLALLLVVGARDWRRFVLTGALAASLTVASYRHTGPWSYWLPIVFLLGVSLAASFPPDTSESPSTDRSGDDSAAQAERAPADLIHAVPAVALPR